MSETLFTVTGADMALLEPSQIDQVWTALGIVVKARAKAERGATKVPDSLERPVVADTPVASPEPVALVDIPAPNIPQTIPEPAADGVVLARADFEAMRRVAPSATGPASTWPAPLPEPVSAAERTDFTARARARADETWSQNHAAEAVIARAAEAKASIERHARGTPTTPIEPLVPPVVAAPPVGTALTPHQRRVLSTVLRLNGDRPTAARELGVVYQSVDVVLEAVGRKGMLPPELIAKLPARFQKYAAVAS